MSHHAFTPREPFIPSLRLAGGLNAVHNPRLKQGIARKICKSPRPKLDVKSYSSTHRFRKTARWTDQVFKFNKSQRGDPTDIYGMRQSDGTIRRVSSWDMKQPVFSSFSLDKRFHEPVPRHLGKNSLFAKRRRLIRVPHPASFIDQDTARAVPVLNLSSLVQRDLSVLKHTPRVSYNTPRGRSISKIQKKRRGTHQPQAPIAVIADNRPPSAKIPRPPSSSKKQRHRGGHKTSSDSANMRRASIVDLEYNYNLDGIKWTSKDHVVSASTLSPEDLVSTVGVELVQRNITHSQKTPRVHKVAEITTLTVV